MTVQQLLVRVRQRLHDMQKVKYADADLIYALNNAIYNMSTVATQQRNPQFVKTMVVKPDKITILPKDFISFVGQYPVVLDEDETKKHVAVTFFDEDYPIPMELRYYAVRPFVTKMEDDIPFRERAQIIALIEATVQDVVGGQNPQQVQQEGGEQQ